MSNSSGPEEIFIGPWHNYGGKTIWNSYVCTLKKDQYDFLNNFLIVFLTLTAERFWAIAVYIIHQCGSHSKPRDGLRRAFEVYVRNSSALGTVTSGWKILAGWTGKSTLRTWFKSLGIIFFALGTLVGFQVGGIYVGRIEIGGIALLKSSDTCGIYVPTDEAAQGETFKAGCVELNKLRHAIRYIWKFTDQTNYTLKDLSPLLNITTIPCPFDSKICATIGNSSASVRVDTGNISVRKLGINSPHDFTIRRVHNCAVLSTEKERYMTHVGELPLAPAQVFDVTGQSKLAIPQNTRNKRTCNDTIPRDFHYHYGPTAHYYDPKNTRDNIWRPPKPFKNVTFALRPLDEQLKRGYTHGTW
ncbi:hypothetical protein TWF281_007693 [Arthrobotrys megalospora]